MTDERREERSDEGMVRLVKAIRSSDPDRIASVIRDDPALISAYDQRSFGATPLIHAVTCGSREMVDLLLDAGADIDQRSDWWAGSFGVLDSANDELASHLLARGATLTAHAAARLGRIDDLRAMLDADGDLVHARGGDGQMPLHFARTVAIADLLLDRGADIDARDIDHDSTAAQWLCGDRPEVATRLVERGAAVDPFLLARIGDTERLGPLVAADPEGPEMTVTRERFPTNAKAAGHIYIFALGDGCSLLHAAAGTGQADTIRWLIGAGADPNARGGYDDQTPLHAAAWENQPDAIAALLDGGTEIDAPSGSIHDNPALGWAIVGGAPDAVRLLIERGASIAAGHRADAAAGVAGEFRQFNDTAPIEAWREIERLVTAPGDA